MPRWQHGTLTNARAAFLLDFVIFWREEQVYPLAGCASAAARLPSLKMAAFGKKILHIF